jgi:light-harvesting protein B-800-850 alpha chain
MIYGKMWTVVKPGVGIPLFLSAVVIGSLAVHLALTLNTTWVKAFLNGGQKAVAMAPAATAAPPAADAAKK